MKLKTIVKNKPQEQSSPSVKPKPKLRLTWKREPNETGLSRVAQAERGYDLRLNGETIAEVRPITRYAYRETVGWYWYGYSDLLGMGINTANKPCKTIEEAKQQCEEYCRRILDEAKDSSKT